MASRGATSPGKPSSFEPSVWGDFFINYEPQPLQKYEEWMRVRVLKLKEEVCMLFNGCNGAVRKMILVDVLQHLGIDHHFERQINTALREILQSDFSNYNLPEVALRFRLLREHGSWISPDVFDKFKDKNGSFSKDITKEPRGLLSLYNAAHLLIPDETSLEEAISFARHHLKSMRGSLKSPFAEQVKRALDLPLPRTYMRVEIVHFISEYKEDEGHNPILLELAKLDFNLHQHLHLKELKSMTKWDESVVPLLPEYLKRFYTELLRNIKEIGDQMAINGNYEIAYIKKQLQNQFSYYLQEAEWTHQCHKPSFDESVNLGVMTICVPTVSVCGVAAMGDAMPKESLEWVVGFPDVVIASGKIARFMNDVAAFNRGKSKGGVANSVECYMADHGVTREVAIARIGSLIEDGWKILNQARFGDRALLPAVQRVINLALSFPLYYGGGNDAFTFSTRLRETIEILFVNPIPM